MAAILFYYMEISMDRYNLCDQHQKEILDKLFWYLGFNEATSFENYIEFMFINTKSGIAFDHVINHTLEHIVKSFWRDYPEYYKSNYIKHFWIRQNDFSKFMSVGDPDEFDPKGLIRYYVKNNFDKLAKTKR